MLSGNNVLNFSRTLGSANKYISFEICNAVSTQQIRFAVNEFFDINELVFAPFKKAGSD